MALNEAVTLTNSVPPTQSGGTTKWKIGSVELNRHAVWTVNSGWYCDPTRAEVAVRYLGDTKDAVVRGIWDDSTDPTGYTLMDTLNTINLSTKSLVKRTLEEGQKIGYIGSGSIL